MKLIGQALTDILIFKASQFSDERGWFSPSVDIQQFNQLLIQNNQSPVVFVQDNFSKSNQGVIRGLHLQRAPYAQGKLIQVIQGKNWHVAVDMRPCSPSFKQWFGIKLSAKNRRQLWLPPGFAHGFIALKDNSLIFYKTTAAYQPDYEVSLKWDDNDLKINWPIKHHQLILSAKDKNALTLQQVLNKNLI